MPRKKEYDIDEVLGKAMMVFWEKGYEGASMQDLVKATGLNRFSMYDAFKNKDGLFVAVLDKYTKTFSEVLWNPLRDNPDGVAAIRNVFNTLIEMASKKGEMTGCLVLNTAIDSPCRNDVIVKRVHKQYDYAKSTMATALKVAIERGELQQDTDPDAWANYLMGILHGFVVMHRINTSATNLKQFIETAFNTLPFKLTA